MFNKFKNFKKRMLKYIFPQYYCIVDNCYNKNASTKSTFIQYCYEHKCEKCLNKKINNRYCYFHKENKCNIPSCVLDCLEGYVYCLFHAAILNEYNYFIINKNIY